MYRRRTSSRWQSAALLMAASCGVGASDTPDTDTDRDIDTPAAKAAYPARALTSMEFTNTVRDLLGVDVDPSAFFVEEGTARGFDHLDESSELSAVSLEQWSLAVRAVAAAARAGDATVRPTSTRTLYPVEAEPQRTGAAVIRSFPINSVWWAVWEPTELRVPFYVPVTGTWRVSMLASATENRSGPSSSLTAYVDGTLAFSGPIRGEVADTLQTPRSIEWEGYLVEGWHLLYALHQGTGMGPTSAPSAPPVPWDPSAFGGAVMLLDDVIVEGPLEDLRVTENPARRALITCDPESLGPAPCARQILEPLAVRAWRRPVSAEEVDRLVALVTSAVDAGLGFHEGVRAAVEALLLSPSFLFKIEGDPTAIAPDGSPLRPYEVATRLAYLVWRSTPDDELLACAAKGGLRAAQAGPCGLIPSLHRLLEDPRSAVLSEHFADRWLQLGPLPSMPFSNSVYPTFSDDLMIDLREETLRVVDELVRSDRPFDDLVISDFTWANQRTADHYGLPPLRGYHFRRVPLADTSRRGILGHGSVLAITSLTNRTSTVRRGVWVLGTLFCETPPPPPEDVPALANDLRPSDDVAAVMTSHLTDPTCAACHASIDPYGVPLEAFDGIGRERTPEESDDHPTEAVLPDGTTVASPEELARAVHGDPRLERCLAETVTLYALGRVPTRAESDAVDGIRARARARGFSFRTLLEEVVTDPLFTKEVTR